MDTVVRWEYSVLDVVNPDRLEALLNDYGERGWRAKSVHVNMAGSFTVVFEREAQPE
jgi:hypothetical protein